MEVQNQNEFKGSSEPSDVDSKAAILCSTLALGNPSNIRIMTINSVIARLKDGILMGSTIGKSSNEASGLQMLISRLP